MKPSILIALLAGGSLAAAGAAEAQKPYKGAPTTVGTGLHGVAAPLPFGPHDWRTVDPDNLLVIDTNKGRVLVELAPLVAPAHVQQIKTLAHQHFYDGQTFFRVIDQFMDQTGDPQNIGKEGGSSLPNLKAEFTFRRGPEMPFVPVAQPGGGVTGFIGSMPVDSQPDALMAMTADHKVSAWTEFCTGVAGMARDQGEDSA